MVKQSRLGQEPRTQGQGPERASRRIEDEVAILNRGDAAVAEVNLLFHRTGNMEPAQEYRCDHPIAEFKLQFGWDDVQSAGRPILEAKCLNERVQFTLADGDGVRLLLDNKVVQRRPLLVGQNQVFTRSADGAD